MSLFQMSCYLVWKVAWHWEISIPIGNKGMLLLIAWEIMCFNHVVIGSLRTMKENIGLWETEACEIETWLIFKITRGMDWISARHGLDFCAAWIGFPRGIRPAWIWAGVRLVWYIRQIVENKGPTMTRFYDFPRGMDWISARYGSDFRAAWICLCVGCLW